MRVDVTDNLGAGTSCVPATPDTYNAGFWYRATSAAVTTVQAVVGFFGSTDCTGGALLQFTLAPGQPILDGGWYQHIGTISAPQGTQSARLSMQVGCSGAPDGADKSLNDSALGVLQACAATTTAWFDDVLLDELAQCSNFADDDLDGFVDYPDDPDCTGASDDSEFPDAQCSDGTDNDLDGLTDYPSDPGCTSASDNNEVNPTLSIGNVTVTEGDSGTTNATFTITKSGSSDTVAQVSYATADGSATAPSDYQPTQGTVAFKTNETTKTITVGVAGDTTPEADESFVVNLSNPSVALIADAQGVGTITNDDAAPQPTFSISDASVTEGNTGTTNATFTVTRAGPAGTSASVSYATADSTATAPNDYQGTSGTLDFGPNETQLPITVAVVGETSVEPDETFFVDLSNPANATISDGRGIGTITNDDAAQPTFSISDATITEGNTGTSNATFTVTKGGPPGASGSISFATADGTATAPSDYQSTSGTVNFGPSETQKPVPVPVVGDTTAEPNETFVVNLSSPTNATINDGQGVGTVTNDDLTVGPATQCGDGLDNDGNGFIDYPLDLGCASASDQTEATDPAAPTEIIDSRFATEPAKVVPKIGLALTVTNAQGGRVTTVGPAARRTSSAAPTAAKISCGKGSYACYATATADQRIQMRATPASGYEFMGWSGACSGQAALCTLTAQAVEQVGAAFAPARPRPARVRFALRKVRVARWGWKGSEGHATIVGNGSVSRPTRFVIEVRRPSGGRLLKRVQRKQSGVFQLSLRLKKKFPGGSRLLPGGYVIAVRGTAQGIRLPLRIQALTMPQPVEGVVSGSRLGTTRGGPRVKAPLPAGSKQAWVTFVMAAQPRSGRIFVRWSQVQPRAAAIGDHDESNRPEIQTGIGASGGINGRFRVTLFAAGKRVSTRIVRVGS
jgi:hypothetical protein